MEGKSLSQTLIQEVFNARLPLLRYLQNKIFKHHVLLEVFNAVFTRLFLLVFNFTAITLITRALSVEDRGKYAILNNLIITFITFFSFGFHTSIIYRLSSNLKLFFPLYVTSFFLSILSLFLIAFLLCFGEFFSYFREIDHWDMIILISGGPIALFSYFNSNFFLGIHKYQKFNLFEFLRAFSTCFLFFILYIFSVKNNYKIYMLLYISSYLIHIFFSFYFFLRNKFIDNTDFNFKINFKKYFSILRKSFRYSMISYISCLLAVLVSKYNLFFIGWFLYLENTEKKLLGYYAVALNNIDIISLLPTMLAFFIFPKISSATNMKIKIKITNQMIVVCIIFFMIIGIVSFTILDYLFDILYGGPIYQEAVPMFQLLLPSALLLAIIGCISSFIGGIGTDKIMIYAPLGGCIFIIISSIFLFYAHANIYYFIYSQNICYAIYFILYINFFIKKWKEA